MSYPGMLLARIALRGPLFSHFAAEFGESSVARRTPHLPYLKQLQICDFDLKRCRKAVSDPMTGLRLDRESVQAVAKAGSDVKSPIRLEIRDCNIDEEQVNLLRSACDGNLE